MNSPEFDISTGAILAARPSKNQVEPSQPYAFFVELERTAAGRVEPVATIFLTNRECPYRCLYCDLWKNTTDSSVAPGAIPEQIDYALNRLPAARHVKLYNSGNFFDVQAIPAVDHQAIADRVQHFDTVIVENHPRLCTDACLRFRDMLRPQLEVAMGLETIHPDVLPALNKRMTVEQFDTAVRFLVGNRISVRAFVLLQPPLLTKEAGATWAVKSLEHAFAVGVSCCAVIAVRAGNGIMDRLQREGRFIPPTLRSLEYVLETGIRLQAGRVFADLWDLERLSSCPRCLPVRTARLNHMNLTQEFIEPVKCDCDVVA